MKDRIYYSKEDQKKILGFVSQPCNYSFDEYEAVFGNGLAKEIYKKLYDTNKRYYEYRSIIPIRKESTRTAQKYVFQLFDEKHIEVVCIQRKTGTTICVSTQVGCSVKCIFCQSGRNGLLRNLNASEIIQQILFVNEDINRIVFMGTGEPLNNYDELIKSIHILRDRNGLDFPTDGITISTVGPIEKLKRLREEHIKIQLVLSLHATNQRTRDFIIPGMIGQPINEIVSLALAYGKRHNRKVTIAYLLLPAINDTKKDIEVLKKWFYGQNVRINLLTYNRISSKNLRVISPEKVLGIKHEPEQDGLEVTIRRSMGAEINAACGQLSTK